MKNKINVFFSYSRFDDDIKKELDNHLFSLRRLELINVWSDCQISPGYNWQDKIINEIENADIILLLISASFNASEYIWKVELEKALQKQKSGETIVVPIFAKPCDYEELPYSIIQGLPRDGRFITETKDHERERVFTNIVKELKKIIVELNEKKSNNQEPLVETKIHFNLGGFEYLIDKYIIESNFFLGIDFGTSTTVLSTLKYEDGKIDFFTIPFEFTTETHGKQKSSLIPSVLFFDKDMNQLHSGFEAKRRKNLDATVDGVNYWSSFKMGLGKDLGNIFTESELNNASPNDNILNHKDATRAFFRALKSRIDKYVIDHKKPENLKLSVSIPASFEANQRRELLEILEEVGYESHEKIFIDEPNAAFLNFIKEDTSLQFVNIKNFNGQHTLVFDFGAGTCDISILEFGKKNNTFYSKNIAISKFEKLGGDDIDKAIARNILFKEFCESYEIDENSISDYQYDSLFEHKLKVPSESLKIKMCEKVKKSKGKIRSETTICLEEPIVIFCKGQECIYESQSITYGQFKDIMQIFIEDSNENEDSIFYVINSALRKAKMGESDIDNVLLIGGSSKNPFIEESLRLKFPKANILIPDDLQTQVSKGTAINALLSAGLNSAPIAPIVSESISILLSGNNYLTLIEQGEEIPHFKTITEKLIVQRTGQKEIEIPLFVSGEEKMLHKILIKLDTGFRKNDLISLTSEIDRNKRVIIKVFCNNIELKTHYLSPFENEVLTPYKKAVKEIEREINNLLSEGCKKTDVQVMQFVDALLTYHRDTRNYKEAMETCIKFFPSKYTDIAYYAANSNCDSIAIEYSMKAFEINPNDINAYNLAFKYSEGTKEFDYYMNFAANLGNISAKIQVAKKLLEENDNQGMIILQEPFDHLYGKYLASFLNMSQDEIDDLLSILELLGDEDTFAEITSMIETKDDKISKANFLFNEENLLRKNTIQKPLA